MNLTLGLAVLERIRTYPQDFDQSHWARRRRGRLGWVCGTAGCFAHHTVMESFPDAEVVWEDGSPSRILRRGGAPALNFRADHSGQVLIPFAVEPMEIAEAAQRLLCISDSDAHILFDADNTFEDLERFVRALGRGIPLTLLVDTRSEREAAALAAMARTPSAFHYLEINGVPGGVALRAGDRVTITETTTVS